jgi:hypothetical protein
MCSVVERRKAIEARLQMLNKRQQMSGPVDPVQSVLTSQLTKKFDAAISNEVTNPGGLKSLNQPKPTRVSVDPPEDLVLGDESGRVQSSSGTIRNGLFRGTPSMSDMHHSNTEVGKSAVPGYKDEPITRLQGSLGEHKVVSKHEVDKNVHGSHRQEGPKSEVDLALSYMTKEAFIRMSSKNAFEDRLHWSAVGIESNALEESFHNNLVNNNGNSITSTHNTTNCIGKVAHLTQSMESNQSTEYSSLRITEVLNDENDRSLQYSGDAATKSLLLADEVATQVKDVLDRFRSPVTKA